LYLQHRLPNISVTYIFAIAISSCQRPLCVWQPPPMAVTNYP
jgi:hypothetical protein